MERVNPKLFTFLTPSLWPCCADTTYGSSFSNRPHTQPPGDPAERQRRFPPHARRLRRLQWAAFRLLLQVSFHSPRALQPLCDDPLGFGRGAFGEGSRGLGPAVVLNNDSWVTVVCLDCHALLTQRLHVLRNWNVSRSVNADARRFPTLPIPARLK
jgi:hypothetical protein